ncbi:MAG: S-layer homology domain-containing protein, partial [Oscillospiraceae bacterium]|nr:S-layer homology domain-containing protein [Oscillospiraceae bacterium]
LYKVEAVLDYKNAFTFTVPEGATAKIFKNNKYYDFTDIPALASKNNEDGTVTYYFNADTKNGNYVFRPDDKITRQEFSAIVCRFMGVDVSLYADVSLPFEDAKSIDSWALPYVKAMYALGISTGSLEYGHLIFAPTSRLTRAQAMAMLGRTQGMGYAGVSLTFSDADSIPSWALAFISPLAGRGVVNGSGGKLNPNGDVTRAEVAKMIYSMS